LKTTIRFSAFQPHAPQTIPKFHNQYNLKNSSFLYLGSVWIELIVAETEN